MEAFQPNFHVCIIGAGIVGLAGGIILRRYGFRVTIVEKDVCLQTIGAGIQLHPNALRVLTDLGVYDALRVKSILVPAIVLKDYATGNALHVQDLQGVEGQYGAPVLTAHRANLRQILFDKAVELGVQFEFGCTATAHGINLGRGMVTLNTDDGSPKSITADLFIGADGANSAVREALMGRKTEAVPHGKVVLRLVIDEKVLQNRADLRHLVENPKINVWLGPESQAVTYSLAGVFNIAITRPGSLDPAKVFFGPRAVDLGALQAELAAESWDSELRELVGLGKVCQQWMLFQPLIDGVLSPWTDRKAKFCIVGDAAHQTLPYLAQGAAMGLESISVLSRLLGTAYNRDQVKDCLALYQHLRKERTAHVTRSGLKNGAIWQLPDGPLKDERNRVFLSETPAAGFPNLLADPVFQSWLWDFDATRAADEAWETRMSPSAIATEAV